MDIANITLTGLTALGVVNVITIFSPTCDSRIKFAASLIAAFAVAFIPAELGSLILDNAKLALTAAFSASGVYKLFQKAGGN